MTVTTKTSKTRKTTASQAAKSKFQEGFNALSDEQQEIILTLIKGFAILYPRDKAKSKAKREART